MTVVTLPPDVQLLLASASPRRRELLDALGIRFLVRPVDLDETPEPGESAEALVRRLAAAKARTGFERWRPPVPVLGADTVVVDEGLALGKPKDRADALAMLGRLSGRAHEVLTAVAVATEAGVQLTLSRSRVVFRRLAPDEAERYWESGEPVDKAGAYGIQGIGGIFVDRLEGSHSGVVGLPLAETERLLRAAGIDTWRHRVPPDRVPPDRVPSDRVASEGGLDARAGGDRSLDEP